MNHSNSMPHRVTNFLRTSSGGNPHIKKPSSTHSNSRSASRTTTPDVSDSEEHSSPATRRHELSDAAKKHHRLSLPFGRSKDHNIHISSAVSVEWNIESPPIVFHGSAEDSTGALVSGQMLLDVKEDAVEVESFGAVLNLHVTHRRPFSSSCPDCRNRNTEIEAWQFLAHPTILRRGRHQYPFSVLLGGHLPASMGSPVVNIDYEFKAEAVIARAPSVKFERTLMVKRSIAGPDVPHHSVRVFPPTNIKASAHYVPVIHPTSINNVTFQLDGLVSSNTETKILDVWKLKKVSWRLQEEIKTNAPGCTKHAPEGTDESKKSVPRIETRTIGERHLHEGWKSDYSGTDGTVDLEFDYSVTESKPYSRDLKYVCDSKPRDADASSGTEVTHSLLVELVVSKEVAPEGKPHLAIQTGTGRILRMHFAVVMTEYSGLGVSWDNEAPPVYQDVPPSPPEYANPLERGGVCEQCPIEYESLEPLNARRSSVERLATPPAEEA